MSLDEFVAYWRRLWDELTRFVAGLLRRRGRPVHYAEDILQQACMTALSRVRLDEIRVRTVRQYIYTCVKHEFINWLRKQFRREKLERVYSENQAQQDQPAQVVDQVIDREAARTTIKSVRKAFANVKLTELERRALLAWLESGGDRWEAAERMGIPDPDEDPTYDQAKYRALKKASRAFKNLDGRVGQISHDLMLLILLELDTDNAT